MNRAIQFKLKNGKVVTIRRVRAGDYDAMMKYLAKFSRDVGAVQTFRYPGEPKKDKEESMRFYESPDRCFIAAWDGDNIIGSASISKVMPKHPYCMGRVAGVGMSVLNKYTRNGLGSKFLQILEKWACENGVKKLKAGIRHKNIASIVNCIKHDFIITGIQYNELYIDGEWQHEYLLEKILEK